MGESVLRDRGTPCERCALFSRRLSKGNPVNIPEPGCGRCRKALGGNTNELGDAGGSPGKSSLFFLTAARP